MTAIPTSTVPMPMTIKDTEPLIRAIRPRAAHSPKRTETKVHTMLEGRRNARASTRRISAAAREADSTVSRRIRSALATAISGAPAADTLTPGQSSIVLSIASSSSPATALLPMVSLPPKGDVTNARATVPDMSVTYPSTAWNSPSGARAARRCSTGVKSPRGSYLSTAPAIPVPGSSIMIPALSIRLPI